ncbi:hypothetical protein BHE74_00019791 [Ensete ventricosum]|nr:hypothetical protein GW17_00014714 [Ensete ventricosum]RWW72396.1 hypothetical protein BHE74_00019791 [Ensete ventricosum]RZR97038.1 hypothetical protein BHM03_00026146 [Ensete ventricosum]
MGLISGLVMGALVGIALMAGWSRMMRRRSTKRILKVRDFFCFWHLFFLVGSCFLDLKFAWEVAILLLGCLICAILRIEKVGYMLFLTFPSLQAADIKLLGSLSRDDLKKLCGDNYPEWVSFPLFEQVKWLNKMLGKLWPFIADAATMVIKETVEPLLDDYRPPGISSLKFSKLSLGNVPPKIEGSYRKQYRVCSIRVQSLKKGQIIMDIDFRWGGDLSIILAVEALVASLPIQLKDLQVFTVIRVIFQLSEEIPCISAVVVALLAEVSFWLSIPTTTTIISFQPKPRIDYTLKAVGGSLTAIPGLSDMIDDTVNSIVSDMLEWPHRIVVPLGGVDVNTRELVYPFINGYWTILQVYDEDKIQQDKKMGTAKLSLNELEPEISKEIELSLLSSLDTLKVKDKKDRGSLTIKVLYHPFTEEEQQAAQEAEKRILEERRKMKEAGLIGSTMDALGGAASLVGSGVGLVGTGLGAGVGLVGSGLGAGVGLVGSGLGAVGGGLSKAGKFMGKSVTSPFSSSKKNGSSAPVVPGDGNAS